MRSKIGNHRCVYHKSAVKMKVVTEFGVSYTCTCSLQRMLLRKLSHFIQVYSGCILNAKQFYLLSLFDFMHIVYRSLALHVPFVYTYNPCLYENPLSLPPPLFSLSSPVHHLSPTVSPSNPPPPVCTPLLFHVIVFPGTCT